MNLSRFLFFALAPVLLACSKNDAGPDCAEQVTTAVTDHTISAAEVQQATTLLSRNQLNPGRSRFIRFTHDVLQTSYPPFALLITDHVGVEEYTNGLRIFTGQVNYVFKDGVLYYTAGRPTQGTALNTQPDLAPQYLRKRFFATIAAFDPGNSSLASECVSAEFGYYNLNASTGNPAERLVKAWKVSVKNRAYPFAYFEDSAGQLIYYDNGIRTFR